MKNIQKCLEFIALQKDINNDINTVGKTTVEKADKLDTMVESLNKQDMDYIIETWDKVL